MKRPPTTRDSGMQDHDTLLRRRAEDILEKTPEVFKEVPPETVKELIHELQVHHTELEMQNDELRRAQLALEEARSKYFELYDAAPVGYFVFDESGVVVDVNLTGARLLGFERRYLRNRPFLGLVRPQDQFQFSSHLRHVFETEVEQACELRLLKKDGQSLHAQLESIAVQEAEGRFRQCRTAVLDITLRKRAEEAIRQSEEQYRELYENAPNAYFSVTAADGSVLRCNAAAENLLGCAKRTITGMKILDLYADTPDGKAKAQRVFKRFRAGESIQGVELQMKRRNGGPVWISLSVDPVRDRAGSIVESRSVVIDISERKLAEKALEVERDNLLNILKTMEDGVYIVDQQNHIEFVNPVLQKEFGPPGKKKCYEYFHGRKKVCPWCKNAEVFAGRRVRWEWHSKRNKRTYDLIDTPLTHPDGSISKLQIFRDVTEYKRMEADLRMSQDALEQRVKERTAELVRANERLRDEIQKRNRVQLALEEMQQHFRELWNNAPAAYHLVDTEGTIMQVNQTELRMLGYTRKEMLGKSIFEFITPEQRDGAEERFRLKLAGKEIPKHDNRIYLNKDGSEVHVSIDDILESDTDGEVIGVRTTMVDISELKRAQEELRHLSARLLEVQENERKRLSRELHDSTGQVLVALRFGIENALDRMRQGTIEESVKSLETISPLAQQAIDEVRKIHTGLRPPLIDDLGIVATISWFCREFETLHAGVRTEQVIQMDETEVPEPLKIVIFRILQEALNNVAKHGKADAVCVSLRRKDGTMELTIEDNGQGFDAERVRSHKEADSGVGLTSMKERTEISGGAFSIESSAGAGTIVRASWQCY